MLAQHWQTIARKTTGEQKSALRVAQLTGLAALRFSGTDVENFLQGYLTSDLSRLSDGEPQLTALTSLKGRVVANGWCRLSAEGQIDWIVHASLADPIATFMQRYLAFSRTELGRPADDHLIVGLIDSDGVPSARIVEELGDLEEILGTHQIKPESEWELACIEAQIPLVSAATSEAFLPQMLGLVNAGAVDFDKGCYLGQEVVARAQHRGEVKRGLTRLHGDAANLLPGSSLKTAEGRELGTVINSCASTCIAVVRLPAVAEYLVEGARLVPAQS